MKLVLILMVSLIVFVITFYGVMFLTMILMAAIGVGSGERDLGLGMLLLTVGVPAWLMTAVASGIFTFKKLRKKLTPTLQTPR
jgi:hypothetical protein